MRRSMVLPARPALAPWCRLVEDDARVLLEQGGTLVTLEGGAARALLPRLLPLLDGTRTREEIDAALGQAAAPAVDNALALLAEHQLLVDGPAVEAGRAAAAAGMLAAAVAGSTTPAAAVDALERARVAVLGTGLLAAELARLLPLSGVSRVETLPLDREPAAGSFVVAAPGQDDLDALTRLNERALRHRDPWLQVLPYDGRFVIAGPVFVPGTSACHACFVTRRAAASGYDEDFDLVERTPRRAPLPPPIVSVAAGLGALLAIRWLATADPTLPGGFYALEAAAVIGLRFDRLLRVPRCAACGPHGQAVPSPWFENDA
jgi:bacteriocin biosynthesis cyclodehydratase domain-containing protein